MSNQGLFECSNMAIVAGKLGCKTGNWFMISFDTTWERDFGIINSIAIQEFGIESFRLQCSHNIAQYTI